MEDLLDQAARFINTTSSHIFLTGKAGTGKTTFLKNLKSHTHKNFIVVAPTGIAALNAGGVTIHSQFLLPPGTFLPDRFLAESVTDQGRVLNEKALARKHPITSARKLVLRSIDLLVIDEVSMLRADLLDAIDYRMKAARGNFRRSFGGAQVLFIGDLFQLPPVVRSDEQEMLGRYYKSPWFYEAHALRNDPPIYIELQKIFRQQDEDFITLLNHLRNNEVTEEDINVLNRHVKPAAEIRELKEVITLTTHNYKADEINQHELRALKTPTSVFDAFIEGEFPENMYPARASLELKAGAQIMFIRNDPSDERKYVNGKLATVLEIKRDEVWVQLADTHEWYQLKRTRWENKRYTLEPGKQELREDVIGSFEQYPVKLAWAITVHKSQGLTFDRAIIDVEQAFAGGQVYVALSRLRSLDGLILRTRIPSGAIRTDREVAAFAMANHQPDKLTELAAARQQHYVQQIIQTTFDFSPLVKDIEHTRKSKEPELDDPSLRPVLVQISEALEKEKANTEKFRHQLNGLLADGLQDAFADRLQKGSIYYRTILSGLLEQLLQHLNAMRERKRVKAYVTQLTELDQALSKKLEEMDKAQVLISGILTGQQHFDFDIITRQRAEAREALLSRVEQANAHLTPERKVKRKSKSKRSKTHESEPSTYEITLQMFRGGLGVGQIAGERGLALSTIEGHLGKAIEAGQLDISALITPAELAEVIAAIDSLPVGYAIKDLFMLLKGRFSYGKLRAVVANRKRGETG
ncbi:MAG: helix-turn-helix domain-containing protein [Cyclobacteriaceae bacterium]